MATKVTHIQLFTEPKHIIENINKARRAEYEKAKAQGLEPIEPQALSFEHVIPHVEGGRCQCVNATYVSGGNPESGRFLLDIVVFEPVPD